MATDQYVNERAYYFISTSIFLIAQNVAFWEVGCKPLSKKPHLTVDHFLPCVVEFA